MRSVLKNIGVFWGVLGICFCLLFSVCALIPQSSIQANCEKALDYFSSHDSFPMLLPDTLGTCTDNYADAALMDVVYNTDVSRPLYSVIAAPYYRIEGEDIRLDLHRSIIDGLSPNSEYSRYWHGMQIFVRPLLTFTSITGCRLILFFLLLALTCVLSAQLLRRKAFRPLIIYLASLLLVQFWVTAFCLEYVSVFLITTAACIAAVSALNLPERKSRIRRMTVILIASGTLTCFFDFLTAETLTFTIPTLLFLLLLKEEGASLSLRETFRLLARLGAAWLAAYAAAFAVKWLLVLFVLGKDAFMNVFESAAVRISHVFASENGIPLSETYSLSLPLMLARNLGCLFPLSMKIKVSAVFGSVAAVLSVLAAVFYLFRGKKTDGAFLFAMLALSLIPFARFFVLSSHSHDHFFFTYRAQMSTIMAIIAAMVYSLRPSEILRTGKKQRRR